MTTTDTRSEEQLGATAGELDPTSSAWLALTTGDAAPGMDAVAPEHGWPGEWFVFLTNFMAVLLGIGAAGAMLGLVVTLLSGDMRLAGLAALVAVGMALGCAVQGSLARHVKHFSRLGWWGAMAELALAALTKVNMILTQPGDWGGAAIGIVIDLLWMGYFWERHGDFDVDLLS